MAVEDKYSVDVKKLMRMTVADRRTLSNDPSLKQELMNALTPTQLAKIFPQEFKMGAFTPAGSGLSAGLSGGLSEASSTGYATAEPISGVSVGEPGSGSVGEGKKAPPSSPKFISSALKRFMEFEQKQPVDVTGQKKEDTKQSTVPGGKKIDRSQFAKELEDPETMRMFAGRMKTEVGGQGRQSQIAWAETTFNRAAARGLTLKQAVSGAYFPTKNPGYSDNATFHDVIREVQKTGSNITNGATGNASEDVGFGYGKAKRQADGSMYAPGQTAAFGGERFGREKPDEKWQPRYIEEEPQLVEIPAEATTVPKEDETKTGAIYPQTDAQGRPVIGPDETQTDVNIVQQNLSKLPTGLPQSFIDDFSKLDQQEQEKILKKIELTGADKSVQLINQFQNERQQFETEQKASQSTVEAIKSTPSATLLQGKYVNENKQNLHLLNQKGFNPLLKDAIIEGAKKTFGDPDDPNTRYEIRIGNSLRNDPHSKHGHGLAADLQIYDREAKKYVGTGKNDIMMNAYGNPYTYNMYKDLSRGMYQYLHGKYGEETANKLSWGGNFFARQGRVGGAAVYGGIPIDSMHYSLGEPGQKGRQGSITGLPSQKVQDWLLQYGITPSGEMGDVAEWKSPYIPQIPSETAITEATAVPSAPEAPSQSPEPTGLGPEGSAGGPPASALPTAVPEVPVSEQKKSSFETDASINYLRSTNAFKENELKAVYYSGKQNALASGLKENIGDRKLPGNIIRNGIWNPFSKSGKTPGWLDDPRLKELADFSRLKQEEQAAALKTLQTQYESQQVQLDNQSQAIQDQQAPTPPPGIHGATTYYGADGKVYDKVRGLSQPTEPTKNVVNEPSATPQEPQKQDTSKPEATQVKSQEGAPKLDNATTTAEVASESTLPQMSVGGTIRGDRHEGVNLTDPVSGQKLGQVTPKEATTPGAITASPTGEVNVNPSQKIRVGDLESRAQVKSETTRPEQQQSVTSQDSIGRNALQNSPAKERVKGHMEFARNGNWDMQNERLGAFSTSSLRRAYSVTSFNQSDAVFPGSRFGKTHNRNSSRT